MLVLREAAGIARRTRRFLFAIHEQINRAKNFPQGRTFAEISATSVVPPNGDFTMALNKKRATRKGWSKKDLGDLKSLAKQKTPARKIGRQLKRSEGAVRQKAYAVGISLSLRKRRRRKK